MKLQLNALSEQKELRARAQHGELCARDMLHQTGYYVSAEVHLLK